MVTHELTVFPDGRVDGSVSARNGDYKSHTLHFVLAEGLTGASAKLMVWAPGAEKAVVYDTAKGNGSCTGQDVTVTPVLWAGPGKTRLQLELLNSAGGVVWQSRRFVVAVEDGIPDDAQQPLVDTSDATLTAARADFGTVAYVAGARVVGENRVSPCIVAVSQSFDQYADIIQFVSWSAGFDFYSVRAGAWEGSPTIDLLCFPYMPGAETDEQYLNEESGEYGIQFKIKYAYADVSLYVDGVKRTGQLRAGSFKIVTVKLAYGTPHEIRLTPVENAEDDLSGSAFFGVGIYKTSY